MYTGYYVGTNADPVKGKATAVTTTTFSIGAVTPAFAANISTGFFALLALLFALFILI
jgi:hypothetical protein